MDASSSPLIVSRTRLSTVGDRAFPVAAARVWNSLPQHITFSPSVTVFQSHLFSQSHIPSPLSLYAARAVTFAALNIIIAYVTYLLTHSFAVKHTSSATPNT